MSPEDIALRLIELLLDVVSPKVAQDFLSQAARERDDAIAEAAEEAKFPVSNGG